MYINPTRGEHLEEIDLHKLKVYSRCSGPPQLIGCLNVSPIVHPYLYFDGRVQIDMHGSYGSWFSQSNKRYNYR